MDFKIDYRIRQVTMVSVRTVNDRHPINKNSLTISSLSQLTVTWLPMLIT